jgi:hypothetical protein
LRHRAGRSLPPAFGAPHQRFLTGPLFHPTHPGIWGKSRTICRAAPRWPAKIHCQAEMQGSNSSPDP